MSRAFVNEDAEGPEPRYSLPPRDDPDFDRAAARALIEGAQVGDSYSAERATGYEWGNPVLRPYIELIRDEARREGNDRFEELADRYLRACGDAIER